MNLKKLFALLLALVMVLSMVACGKSGPDDETSGSEGGENAGTPTTVTISTIYGDVEVPYSPKRVCVLDSAALDYVHTLGFGKYVVCTTSGKNTPEYLDEYYNSDSIVLIQGSKNKGNKNNSENQNGENQNSGNQNGGNQNSGNTATETTDPYEAYYAIDADVIIATSFGVTEDLYNVLSQIAPTVVFSSGTDGSNLYGTVKATAKAVASIWGAENKADEMFAPYDAIYTQLSAKMSGKNALIMESDLTLGRLEVEEVDEDAISAILCGQLGMSILNVNIPEEVINASESGGHGNHSDEEESNTEGNAQGGSENNRGGNSSQNSGEITDMNGEIESETVDQSANNKIIADWVESIVHDEHDYIILSDESYDSLDAASKDGYSCAELDALTARKEGRICMVIDVKGMNLGIGSIFTMLDQLNAFFAD